MELRIGLIGCGRISPMHLASIKRINDARIISVCDIKEDRAAKTAEQYNCSYYLDYKEMIRKENLDIVHICTPHYLHHDMAVFAAENGVHVVTEKPMAIKYEDAVDMVNICSKNEVELAVIFQNRYNRAVQFIRNEIKSGRLGKPLAVRVIVTWDRNDDYYVKSDWKGTWDKEGGGVIIDQAIHSLDIARYILDLDVKNVQADLYNKRHKKFEIEDTAIGTIEFDQNIVLSFYTMNYFTYDAPIEIMFHCEKGTANIIGDEGYIYYDDGRCTTVKPLDDDKIDYGNGVKKYWGYCHFVEIEKIYECIREKRHVEISGEDCLKTQKMINAIYESGKDGGIVSI